MRLWHEALIPLLPRQQLLGQHRECCALRGKGWGRPHATVNYVFEHPYEWLWAYHVKVMREMFNRGYKVSPEWLTMGYQGKSKPHRVYCHPGFEHEVGAQELCRAPDTTVLNAKLRPGTMVYPEHNREYMQECLDNLSLKGIYINGLTH